MVGERQAVDPLTGQVRVGLAHPAGLSRVDACGGDPRGGAQAPVRTGSSCGYVPRRTRVRLSTRAGVSV